MPGHVCHWWLAYSFDNPLRRLVHDPARILQGLVLPGNTVIDIGCGFGFFTLAMAKMVGDEGRVIALDIQRQMLDRTRARARRRRLEGRIDFHLANQERLGVTNAVDFALAFWMVHETVDRAAFFSEVVTILKPEARLMIAEPRMHVSSATFRETIDIARLTGLEPCEERRVRFSRATVLRLSRGE